MILFQSVTSSGAGYELPESGCASIRESDWIECALHYGQERKFQRHVASFKFLDNKEQVTFGATKGAIEVVRVPRKPRNFTVDIDVVRIGTKPARMRLSRFCSATALATTSSVVCGSASLTGAASASLVAASSAVWWAMAAAAVSLAGTDTGIAGGVAAGTSGLLGVLLQPQSPRTTMATVRIPGVRRVRHRILAGALAAGV
jgi:hypothetical protein